MAGPEGIHGTRLRDGPTSRRRLALPHALAEGTEHSNRGVVREVVEPERLVFTFAWDEEDGKPGREMLITITLAERRDQTEMTFSQAVFESVEDRDGHQGGWSESFDKLAAREDGLNMGTRSESLAIRVDQSNKDLLAAVEERTPDLWAARCSDGEWTQGFAAFHAATAVGEIT